MELHGELRKMASKFDGSGSWEGMVVKAMTRQNLRRGASEKEKKQSLEDTQFGISKSVLSVLYGNLPVC